MSIRLTGSHGTWVLPEGETLIGRSTSCGICVLDARLSRRHAAFHVRGGVLTVADRGSTNGVLVNGRPSPGGSTVLLPGDHVVVGPCLLTVRSDGEPPPAVLTAIDSSVASERRVAEAATATAVGSSLSAERRLDPLIAAAVTPVRGTRKSDTDTHRPSDYLEPGTEAVTHKPPSGESVLAPEERAAVLEVAHESAATIHDEPAPPQLLALDAPTAIAPPGLRLAAGALDAVQTCLVSLVASTPIAVLGYAVALRQAGARLVEGVPVLDHAPAPAAGVGDLALSLIHPGGLGRVAHLVEGLQAEADRTPFLVLYLAVTLAVLVFLLTHLLSTVVATVLRGGPFWHRWLGLTIVQVTTDAPPTWGFGLRRWGLLLLLWPLAPITALRGQDGLHDRWSRCAVRRQTLR
jgi:hypothetical protein